MGWYACRLRIWWFLSYVFIKIEHFFVFLAVTLLEKLYKPKDSVAFDVGEEPNGGQESDFDETIPEGVSDGSWKLGCKRKQKEYSDGDGEKDSEDHDASTEKVIGSEIA